MTTKALRNTVLLGAWLPLTLCSLATVLGQETLPGVPGRPPRLATSGGAPEPSILSVEFKGGTIEEYIGALSSAAPNLNVVIRPETKDAVMPPVSLKAVAYSTALQLIPALAESAGEIAVMPVVGGGGSEVYVIRIQPPRAQPMGQSLQSMMTGVPGTRNPAQAIPAGAAPGRPFKSVRVFSLKGLTSGQGSLKPETVLTAIDTALGLQRAEGTMEAASIKLHAESGLLVIHGDSSQIDAVEQVLSAMERDLRTQSQAQQETLLAENAKLKVMLDELTRRIADLEGSRPLKKDAAK